MDDVEAYRDELVVLIAALYTAYAEVVALNSDVGIIEAM